MTGFRHQTRSMARMSHVLLPRLLFEVMQEERGRSPVVCPSDSVGCIWRRELMYEAVFARYTPPCLG